MGLARRAQHQNRGGGALKVSLDEAAPINKVTEARAAELLAVDEALEKLTAMDARSRPDARSRRYQGDSVGGGRS